MDDIFFAQAADEIEALRNTLRWVVCVYIVDDEACDQDSETERTMQRMTTISRCNLTIELSRRAGGTHKPRSCREARSA